ncbi:DegT/DnrJ/EryC1/StrS family aminotransferase [Sphingomonas sp. Mn802worker]|uniref:DegT/DnrJ/EryC1/StrS family aminotransferase n=1 Tax=Sphingomonas sp. Mn802worker TaxID=629773 RepID=UPI00039A232D|nr:DegT/DnrJ/EryC1/StrS family aminotransferase [Sphingomonas sp. Mn802worker]
MTVPFLDLKAANESVRSEINAAIGRVLDSGWLIGGPEVERFEQMFAAYCEAGHCIGVGNGLDALHLLLRAAGIGPGDEVIVASNTFIATWLAVDMVGATPVPVEPDPATHNLDPNLVEQAITLRTRAVLVTHLYGQPADLDPLLDLCQRHGLKLFEDAAQAHGARYKGRVIGGHGDGVAWSFYPSKNLGALGDGGAVTCNDAQLASRIRALGNYGSERRYVNIERGVNSRLDPIHAAAIAVKLPLLDAWNDHRRSIAALYMGGLSDAAVILPHVPDWADPVWHLFVIRTKDRENLQAYLTSRGVQTLIHYPIPPHRQQAYTDNPAADSGLPIAEQLASEVLSLPIGPQMPLDHAQEVIAAIRDWCRI